jgi:hypothetical protein
MPTERRIEATRHLRVARSAAGRPGCAYRPSGRIPAGKPTAHRERNKKAGARRGRAHPCEAAGRKMLGRGSPCRRTSSSFRRLRHERTRNAGGPISPFRPILGKPPQSLVEAADGDVTSGPHRGKLFAVGKDAVAYRLFFDTHQTGVLSRQMDKVMNRQHGAISGILTANVNGFLTAVNIFDHRSKYRSC